MRKLSNIFLSTFLVAVTIYGAALAADGNGGYAGAFLQVPIGARPTGMGGAYIAVSDDAAAPLFNPAGVANLRRPLFGSSYRVMQLDRKLGYVSAIFPIHGNAALGGSWLYAGSGSVAARNSDGDLTGEELANNTHQFSVVFAKRFESWFSFGANLCYLYSRMPEFSAASVGFDVGAIFYLDQLKDREAREDAKVKDIQVGVLLKNLTKRFDWNSENYNVLHETQAVGVEQKDKFPLEFGLGVSARFFERKLLVASDLRVRQYLGAAFHGGAEYYLTTNFLLRSGFSDGRFTAGTGYLFELGGKSLFVDYAFSTDKADEGSEHIFSIDLQF